MESLSSVSHLRQTYPVFVSFFWRQCVRFAFLPLGSLGPLDQQIHHRKKNREDPIISQHGHAIDDCRFLSAMPSVPVGYVGTTIPTSLKSNCMYEAFYFILLELRWTHFIGFKPQTNPPHSSPGIDLLSVS